MSHGYMPKRVKKAKKALWDMSEKPKEEKIEAMKTAFKERKLK